MSNALPDPLPRGVTRGLADPSPPPPAESEDIPLEVHASGQLQPRCQSTFSFALPVLVVNTTEPDPPKVRVLGLRDNEGIFDRDTRLVIVAVQYPLLELDLRQITLMHKPVKGMLVMVAGRTLVSEPLHERFLQKRTSMLIGAHSLISIPSEATSHPAASTVVRSEESSRNIGLVLLIWTNTLRGAVILESIARLPPGPPTGQ